MNSNFLFDKYGTVNNGFEAIYLKHKNCELLNANIIYLKILKFLNECGDVLSFYFFDYL